MPVGAGRVFRPMSGSRRNPSVDDMDITMNSPTTEIETVIVGAGQTGLSTAYFLARAGIPAIVLDEHPRVGDQWRSRYASLRLNTPARYDSLPGMPFPADGWSYPSGSDMADYLEAYVARFGLDVRHRVTVSEIRQQDDGRFLLCTNGDALCARHVVVATGSEHHPHTPEVAAELDPGIRQLHSSMYRGPQQLLPGPVLVVGAGQSGADLALEVAHAGHETWLSGTPSGEVPFEIGSRRSRVALPVLWFAANHVLTMRNPLTRGLQPKIRSLPAPLIRTKMAHLVAAGVHTTPERTTGSRDGRPMLADGHVLDVTNVVWCTGFRRDFSFIHPPIVADDGWPRDDGGVARDVAGLYFVGLLYQRGFFSMLIGGARRDARYIADQIAARRVAARRVAEPALATA
jgi:putative flavoprotein involved in K+ transport